MTNILDFLKKLLEYGDRELTVILLNDEAPESSNSFSITPRKLLLLFYGSIAITIIVVLLFVMFTPLGTLVYNKEDAELRASVIEVSQKVESLQDSLQMRDMQLYEIQSVLAEGRDTSFGVGDLEIERESFSRSPPFSRFENSEEETPAELISKNEVIFSNVLKEAPDFPAPYPASGTLTREFNYNSGHYGIDIATSNESVFRAISDGSVVNQDWTVSYGYVLHVQHRNGIISVYKHATSLTKDVGDIVLKGDILGTVGDTGVVSSGPHLHVEIWKNGVPQNPLLYLLNS